VFATRLYRSQYHRSAEAAEKAPYLAGMQPDGRVGVEVVKIPCPD